MSNQESTSVDNTAEDKSAPVDEQSPAQEGQERMASEAVSSESSTSVAEGFVMSDQAKSISGLTEEQALDFHEQFKVTFTTFMVLSAAAHLLVYIWRPWF